MATSTEGTPLILTTLAIYINGRDADDQIVDAFIKIATGFAKRTLVLRWSPSTARLTRDKRSTYYPMDNGQADYHLFVQVLTKQNSPPGFFDKDGTFAHIIRLMKPIDQIITCSLCHNFPGERLSRDWFVLSSRREERWAIQHFKVRFKRKSFGCCGGLWIDEDALENTLEQLFT